MNNKRKLSSLNCSKATVPTDATTSISTGTNDGSNTPNTPDILNEIINISNDHLEEICKQMKTENENNMLKPVQNYNPAQSDIGHYSQMIKQGLKLKVKEKIKTKTEVKCSDKEREIFPYEHDHTGEDEERRKRRRERNKIAATKCRNKKKERTTRLIAEGEVLEIQNAAYREEIKKLKAEQGSLEGIFNKHRNNCKKRNMEADKETENPVDDYWQEKEYQVENKMYQDYGCTYENDEISKRKRIKTEVGFFFDNFNYGYSGSYYQYQGYNNQHYESDSGKYHNNFQSFCLSNYSSDYMCLAL